MLIHSNATINISRFTDTAWVKTRSVVKSGYAVYINARAEAVVQSIDSQWAYKEFMMMTDGLYDVLIGDKIVWGARNFVVQGWENFSDLTGTHWQYILMEDYD